MSAAFEAMAIVHTLRQTDLHEAELVMVLELLVTLAAIPVAFVRSTLADLFWAVLLVAVSVEWLLVDKPVEGRVLLSLDRAHGVTSGDLLMVPAVGLAVALTVRWLVVRRRRRAVS